MKKGLSLLPLSLFFLNSCVHYYYSPNQQNVPLFHAKKEGRISGAVSFGEYIVPGVEAQGSYAVTKNVGLLANVSIHNPGKNSTGSASSYETGYGNRGRLYELGAGYYKPFKSILARTKVVFENYGVAGIGHVRGLYYNDSLPSDIVNAQFIKIYDQPSIGVSHDIVDFILSAKIGSLVFYKMDARKPGYSNSEMNEDIAAVRKHRASFLFEPAATLRLGFRWVKLNSQFGFRVMSNRALRDRSLIFNFNIGIIISLATRFKDKYRTSR